MADIHQSVLLAEAMELLAVRPGGTYVDGTVGMGGHARAILERSAPDGRLIAFDRDDEALDIAKAVLAEFGDRVRFIHDDFREAAAHRGAAPLDGVLLDLGTSSMQLDTAERGFSFRHEAPLDMRMDRSRGETAAQALRRMTERQIADMLHHYGEEPFARRIARAIVESRREAPLRTTGDLANLVRRTAPRSGRKGHDAATRTFQALRIHVNDELRGLASAIDAFAAALAVGGRLIVIAFHSLEDRIVKHAFRDLGHRGYRVLTRKPLRPSDEETARNPRSRSACLRAIEREAA